MSDFKVLLFVDVILKKFFENILEYVSSLQKLLNMCLICQKSKNFKDHLDFEILLQKMLQQIMETSAIHMHA